MREKNHQAPPTIRPESDLNSPANRLINDPFNYLGVMSVPCCIKEPRANQRLLPTEKELVTLVPPSVPSIFHSRGENLQ